MLDLDHPMTEHIFRASGLMDAIMGNGQTMTVSPSIIRMKLLDDCTPYFVELRELARTKFSDNAAHLLFWIDQYEVSIRKIAELGRGQILEDRRDGKGNCPYCGTKVLKITPFPWKEDYFRVLCSDCCNLYQDAKEKLSWGFGTVAI
ncbi:hypothetical protein [Armatimonas sp.]|uniref:hypothetical protein n=1 Tax=Armatimonas sp. TaxID=1872638 RepID=UPI00374DBDB9